MIQILFWLAFLACIPITMAVFFIKNRSSVASWIRAVQHPERWLLCATLPKESHTKEINALLRKIVSEARNLEWDASCTYKCRNHETGEWTIGLISNSRPINTAASAPFQFSHLPSSQTIRISGHPRDEHDTVKSLLQQWAEKKNLQYSPTATSLSAQSFQCWEWDIVDNPTNTEPSWPRLSKAAELIFEMRDILLYPTLFTLISIIMCGTGSPWLFGIGIFLVILMSGACRFVFLHQREDATQESHLQNY